MKHFRNFSLIVLVLGAIVYLGAVFGTRKVVVQKLPFTLTTATFRIVNDRAPVLEHVTNRFVRSPGNWKEIRTDVKSQTVRTQVAKDGNQYEVGTEKQEWLSRAIAENEVWSLDELRTHPQFVRTEQLLGLQVYVFRNEISAQDWGEMWFAPETGRIPLKIHTSYDGGKEQHIVEPISLNFGEIPDSVFDGPTLPVSFERVQELIKTADEQGGHEYAEAMRRSLTEAQRKKQ
ncbi:MAG: hypothetical protein WAV20_11870 [Blastocatellia bacterium]